MGIAKRRGFGTSFDPKDFRQEVIGVQFQLKDHLSKPGDPLASQLKTDLQRMEDNLQSDRHTDRYAVRKELIAMRDKVNQAGHDHVLNYSTENSIHHWLDHHINDLR